MKFKILKTDFDISLNQLKVYLLVFIGFGILSSLALALITALINTIEFGSFLPVPQQFISNFESAELYRFSVEMMQLESSVSNFIGFVGLCVLFAVSKRIKIWDKNSATNYAALGSIISFTASLAILLVIILDLALIAGMPSFDYYTTGFILQRIILLIPDALFAGVSTYLILNFCENYKKTMEKHLSSILFATLIAIAIPYLIELLESKFISALHWDLAGLLARTIDCFFLILPIIAFAIEQPKKYLIWIYPAVFYVVLSILDMFILGTDILIAQITISLVAATVYCVFNFLKK